MVSKARAARNLRVSRRVVENAVKEGLLDGRVLGRRTWITAASVSAFAAWLNSESQ